MEMPIELKQIIEAEISSIELRKLREISAGLTGKYRQDNNFIDGFKTREEALVYASVRMPATYGAVSSALYHALECCQANISSIMDVGAGTGAATFAVSDILAPSQITCIERAGVMRDVGEFLMSKYSLSSKPDWISADVTDYESDLRADLVLCSYMFNELKESDIVSVAQRMYRMADKLLLIVEPGTVKGHKVLQKIRTALLENGAAVAAPCVSDGKCPMAEDDWCHFTCRISRSKLHKQIKNADVPYEDEKFSYMAFVREKEYNEEKAARVLRHPDIAKACITHTLCTGGEICMKDFRKRDGDLYRRAKKSASGDLLIMK